MLLLIDNYDSFTYNLYQYLGELGQEVRVERNDALGLDSIAEMRPERIVVSPGPCTPNEAGISMEVIRHFAGKIPILGVCLGHQAIGQVFGGEITRLHTPMHGKLSEIRHEGAGVFRGLNGPFKATRYHSLVVDRDSIPADLQVTAEADDGVVMGLSHRNAPLHGVQFHPESILSEHGHRILRNFLDIAGDWNRTHRGRA
jgi:anthranilate synthase component 2